MYFLKIQQLHPRSQLSRNRSFQKEDFSDSVTVSGSSLGMTLMVDRICRLSCTEV